VFKLGDVLIPAIQLQFRDASGRVYQRYTDPVPVKVVEVKKKPTDKKDDIRPIKPPVSANKLLVWTVILGGAAVLLILIVAVLVVVRKRRHYVDPESLKPPHERAALECGRLKNSTLLQEGKTKEFYSELSAILKRYLDRRYQLDTLELTTQEVMDLLRSQSLPSAVIEKVKHVLENSDLVKFARFVPERNFADKLSEEILAVAEETKPLEEAKP
jgi:hypothetical protein